MRIVICYPIIVLNNLNETDFSILHTRIHKQEFSFVAYIFAAFCTLFALLGQSCYSLSVLLQEMHHSQASQGTSL